VDVGQHQMWAGQSLDLLAHQRFLTSGGMGSMGYALPAAIGAAMASGAPVVMIAGDGGFQCNIQELETVAHHRLPIRMVIVDNHCLGMVRQFQESYFDGRYPSTLWGYSAPDFVRVAEAYGIPGRAVEDPAAVEDAVKWLGQAQGPALLHLKIDAAAHATRDRLRPQRSPQRLDGRLSLGTLSLLHRDSVRATRGAAYFWCPLRDNELVFAGVTAMVRQGSLYLQASLVGERGALSEFYRGNLHGPGVGRIHRISGICGNQTGR
jgi:hypothetical protein